MINEKTKAPNAPHVKSESAAAATARGTAAGPKPEAIGLTRDEIRRIVLDIIG